MLASLERRIALDRSASCSRRVTSRAIREGRADAAYQQRSMDDSPRSASAAGSRSRIANHGGLNATSNDQPYAVHAHDEQVLHVGCCSRASWSSCCPRSTRIEECDHRERAHFLPMQD